VEDSATGKTKACACGHERGHSTVPCRQRGQAVQEATHVVLLHVLVQTCLEVVGVLDDLGLEAVINGAEHELLVSAARHEVYAGVAVLVGSEGQIKEIFGFDIYVAHLNARRQHRGARGDAHSLVEVLEPRAHAVDDGARRDGATVAQLHASGLAALSHHRVHTGLKVHLDALPLAGLEHVFETRRRV
jgi:urease gamma subunit